MMTQWQKSKVMRDPQALADLAANKGLKLSTCPGIYEPFYQVFSGSNALAGGTLEKVGAFLDKYTAVTVVAGTAKRTS